MKLTARSMSCGPERCYWRRRAGPNLPGDNESRSGHCDGMAIAYEAGAVLSDMEFVQFHPTALAVKARRGFFCPRRCARRRGAAHIGLERFMKRYNEAQELAPRDIVARRSSARCTAHKARMCIWT